jgi:hypothetical protein
MSSTVIFKMKFTCDQSLQFINIFEDDKIKKSICKTIAKCYFIKAGIYNYPGHHYDDYLYIISPQYDNDGSRIEIKDDTFYDYFEIKINKINFEKILDTVKKKIYINNNDIFSLIYLKNDSFVVVPKTINIINIELDSLHF